MLKTSNSEAIGDEKLKNDNLKRVFTSSTLGATTKAFDPINSNEKANPPEDTHRNILVTPSYSLPACFTASNGPIFQTPFSFLSYFNQYLLNQQSLQNFAPHLKDNLFSSFSNSSNLQRNPEVYTTNQAFQKKDHLSASYNFIARQLHDTECHVIQLRKSSCCCLSI